MTAPEDPCSNAECLRCHPELRTYEVKWERVERVVRSRRVRAVDEKSAIEAFRREAFGAGGYLFDMTLETIEEKPIIAALEGDALPDLCYHDCARHLAGCALRLAREANDYTSRDCTCVESEGLP